MELWYWEITPLPQSRCRIGLDEMRSFVRRLRLRVWSHLSRNTWVTLLNSASCASPQTYRITPSVGRKLPSLPNSGSGFGVSDMSWSSSLKLRNKESGKGWTAKGYNSLSQKLGRKRNPSPKQEVIRRGHGANWWNAKFKVYPYWGKEWHSKFSSTFIPWTISFSSLLIYYLSYLESVCLFLFRCRD